MLTLIKNATVVNERKQFKGGVLIEGDRIKTVFEGAAPEIAVDKEIDAEGLLLLPGVIDDQVHFRDPGLTHKGDLYTEPKAAVAGGVTSFMEMPNTKPGTVSIEALEAKYDKAAQTSLANFSFYMGTTNDNYEEVASVDYSKVCGVKIFMGSSTGNMLVDSIQALEKFFCKTRVIIATHCEDDPMIAENLAKYKAEYGDDIPVKFHPYIRSREACYASSSKAVKMAEKCNTRLHILHISTKEELELFRNDIPHTEKRITAEACVHHLWFSEEDYDEKGTLIKWNPAVKTKADREAIFQAILDDKIDVIATDHAPHTLEEKQQPYTSAPSGGPLIQHSLVAMMEFVRQGKITVEKVVEKMVHNVADLFDVVDRGYIREGYFADLVLVNPDNPWTVAKENILYKCGWSPFEGVTFNHKIDKTFVNGHMVYDNGAFDESQKGTRLFFNRTDEGNECEL
ncbi:MAG: dihydroorotase [Crocinitomicaceae bacterium]|nr:dihydroorotase [Crocinitomicaceae bacterium]